jgi:DNA-binding IclR family transcriptional regulator
MENARPPAPAHTIPNVIKSCAVLSLLGKRPQGTSLGEVSRMTGVPKTSAYRMLRSFCHTGFAREDKGLYRCGMGVVQVGLAALTKLELHANAQRVLKQLVAASGEAAHLAVAQDQSIFLLDTCDSPHPARLSADVGTAVPLHCSAPGKVLLAFSIRSAADLLLAAVTFERRTERTLTSRHRLEAELEIVRRQGYAVDDGELQPDVRCVAAPVRDREDRVIAAIGITTTAARLPYERLAPVTALVIEAAAQLSQALGWHGSDGVLQTAEAGASVPLAT